MIFFCIYGLFLWATSVPKPAKVIKKTLLLIVKLVAHFCVDLWSGAGLGIRLVALALKIAHIKERL